MVTTRASADMTKPLVERDLGNATTAAASNNVAGQIQRWGDGMAERTTLTRALTRESGRVCRAWCEIGTKVDTAVIFGPHE